MVLKKFSSIHVNVAVDIISQINFFNFPNTFLFSIFLHKKFLQKIPVGKKEYFEKILRPTFLAFRTSFGQNRKTKMFKKIVS